MIFQSPPQIPSHKTPISKVEKGKKSQICDNALVLFPCFRLFGGGAWVVPQKKA